MFRILLHLPCIATIVFSFGASFSAMAQYGAEVVSYDAGSSPAPGYTTASVALGEPERFTGEGVFPGIVSPFSPPFLTSEIVSVGDDGHITLKLSHFALPQAGLEIGVFENVGLVMDFANFTATNPVSTFGEDSAMVEVSANGTEWRSLGTVLFDRPTNGYTDLSDPFSGVPGSALADFQQPFVADLGDFAGLPYADPSGPDVLDVLAGSGGGTWLDISSTGLPRVGYIRFSVAGAGANFELDAVSIARGAVGRPVPEPTMTVIAATLIASVVNSFRRRRALH
ncbi:MAG: hypothetical protein L0228_04840 [Planctomycetes bacterium]|nr:hypothetical protein [Planctomycetota bacterium]